MNKDEKLVAVYTASNELEARIIQDVLERNNISSMLLPLISLPSAYSPTQIHGSSRLMVLESLAESARKLIGGEDNV